MWAANWAAIKLVFSSLSQTAQVHFRGIFGVDFVIWDPICVQFLKTSNMHPDSRCRQNQRMILWNVGTKSRPNESCFGCYSVRQVKNENIKLIIRSLYSCNEQWIAETRQRSHSMTRCNPFSFGWIEISLETAATAQLPSLPAHVFIRINHQMEMPSVKQRKPIILFARHTAIASADVRLIYVFAPSSACHAHWHIIAFDQ